MHPKFTRMRNGILESTVTNWRHVQDSSPTNSPKMDNFRNTEFIVVFNITYATNFFD